MKQLKLYNVIFPIWFILFLPPVILVTLAGNFLIDSLVLIGCYYCFKLAQLGLDLKTFYKKSIVKVWLFGFLADFAGAALLFVTGLMGDFWGLPYDIASAVNYDPFSHPLGVLIIVLAMIVAGILIFFFNHRFIFPKLISDAQLRFKTALAIALITIPWTFLLPTKWFY